MIIILRGVSGAGKTTVGTALAKAMHCEFLDADDYHPPANKQKMSAGQPLNDDDRQPWLLSLNALIAERSRKGQSAVLACSALKGSYQQLLKGDEDNVVQVLLSGSFDQIAERVAAREHAFMTPALLQSQFDTLETEGDDLVVSVALSVDEIVNTIRHFIAQD